MNDFGTRFCIFPRPLLFPRYCVRTRVPTTVIVTDCAVCETSYSSSFAHTCTRCSSSRRQGLVAATVIAAIVAVFGIVAIFRYMLTTEHEEENVGCFHRRVVRAIPLQALKITVVVWQILTQVCARHVLQRKTCSSRATQRIEIRCIQRTGIL